MNILIINSQWVGGHFDYFSETLQKLGHTVLHLSLKSNRSILRTLKLHNICQVNTFLQNKDCEYFNNNILKALHDFKPELFIAMNESNLFPNTIRQIQRQCKTLCDVSDNPFDSRRYSYFPITLKYYDFIMVAEKSWISPIQKIAPNAKIAKYISGGAYFDKLFFPVEEDQISEEEKRKLSCDISFTGESYGMLAEGAYRAGILDLLGNYNVKIWGDKRWKLRFPYYDHLKNFYQGERLSFEKLRKLYFLSTINLNMPSPQIISGFQPRVFEIAACKGFQIVDWREELDEIFREDELVTFKNIPDLIEKIDYFVQHPDKRLSYVEKMYHKVTKDYSWERFVEKMMNLLKEEKITIIETL